MGESIFRYFSFLTKEVALFIVSMLPVIELRGAIPLGALFGMGMWETFLISVVGNLLPVPFLILLTRPLFKWLRRRKLFAGLVQKIENRAAKKADKIMKDAALGLFLFVAIPIPGTGAWTGAMIASLFDMRFKYALPTIAAGVVVAGVIMTVASFLVPSLLTYII